MATKMTIRDVARLAGVSIATVSRVLNEKPDVDPATRERILRILAEQRFVPSVAGTGLAGGRTGLIGILVPSMTWSIMTTVLTGVADAVEQTSYEMVLYSLGRKRERGEIIHRIADANLVDGLIAVYPDGVARLGDVPDGDRRVSQHLSSLYEQGLPIVVVDDQGAHDDMPWISSDNRHGAAEAVRYLVSLGHRRIAHITGPQAYLCSRDRLEGYRAALEEAGLHADPHLEVQGDFTSSGGRTAAARLFALPEPPTAIFAANDDLAYGVIGAAGERGLCVPEDVAVVGFDDAGPSALTHPPLTTIRQPFFDIGRQAARTLLALVDAPAPRAAGSGRWHPSSATRALSGRAPSRDVAARVQLPVQLVERQSTRPSWSSRMGVLPCDGQPPARHTA